MGVRGWKLGAGVNGVLPLLYLLFGCLSAVVFVCKLPPFMGPDEPNQLRRANQVSHGEVIGHRFRQGDAVTSGGQCETNLDAIVGVYEPLRQSPTQHVTPAMGAAAGLIPWGASTADEQFSNTAAYPPVFYVPESVGIAIGKTRGDAIVRTLTLARAFNAIACLFVGAFALKTASRGRLFLFCVLLLPMTLEMSAVVTQDGLIIATAALACALMIRGPDEDRPMTREELLAAGICLFLVGISKPPYALLALLLLLVRTERPTAKFLALGAVLLPVLAWHAWMTTAVQTPILRPDATVNEPGQIAFVLHHPASLATVPIQTLRTHVAELASQMVGNLGWLDTPLPKPYILLACLALALAGAMGFSGVSRRGWFGLLILFVTGVAVIGGLYLAYTPVGNASADGVQGRYFLPLLAFLPLVLGGAKGPAWTDAKWAKGLAWGIAVGFPSVGILVIWRALTLRYYG